MRVLTQTDLRAAEKASNSNVAFKQGITVESFNLLELATAIEHEANEATGNNKVSLHMDAPDAMILARNLRMLALLR